jgi:hypothetical protein
MTSSFRMGERTLRFSWGATTSTINERSIDGAGTLHYERGLSRRDPSAIKDARSGDLPPRFFQNNRLAQGIALIPPILVNETAEQQSIIRATDVPAVS